MCAEEKCPTQADQLANSPRGGFRGGGGGGWGMAFAGFELLWKATRTGPPMALFQFFWGRRRFTS